MPTKRIAIENPERAPHQNQLRMANLTGRTSGIALTAAARIRELRATKRLKSGHWHGVALRPGIDRQ